jgi:glycine/D-amino acid oxidase-like deaminating enzyme
MFGVTAALALRRRDYAVSLFDPGPLPHPLAASTDISKHVRLDYGPDEAYMALMEQAFEGWFEWNEHWPEELFHNVGLLYATRAHMQPGEFEHESFQRMLKRAHAPERLDAESIVRRFPAWRAAGFVDGYFNPLGGHVESGRVMAWLIERARAEGVAVHAGKAFARLLEAGSRVGGLLTTDGERHAADFVIVAAGAWTHFLLPWLSGPLRATGCPVFHLRPHNPELFEASVFPDFSANIAVTGYYGFPLNRDGVVKIAHHGPGRSLHPSAPERGVSAEEIAHLRAFLQRTFPDLAEAELVFTRQCFYSDTWDGHFWIDHDPDRPGLLVAAGDSGHGFKFAPVLGDLIADLLERKPHPLAHRFRWRPDVRPTRSEEAARQQ